MTVDLWMLIWSVVLTFALMVISVLGAMLQAGPMELAGNREGFQALAGWPGRAERAYRNMLEALPLFAVLVIVAHLTKMGDAQTAMGAQLFLYARILHAVVYLIGIHWVRTLVWLASAVGLVMMALPFLPI